MMEGLEFYLPSSPEREVEVSKTDRNADRTKFARSHDGTPIAYETLGSGPTLLVVNGALGYRDMSFAKQLTTELAKHFTVIDYDRRGRGQSGDQRTYSVDREIEDISAVIQQAAGGPCYVFAQSSGAALALRAAAAGVPMKALVAYEPPYMVGNPKDRPAANYREHVTALIADGRRDEAVKYFMLTVGVPRFFVGLMRLFPFWKQMVAAAGEKTTPTLKRAAEAVAETVPAAQHRLAPKMSHAVKPAVLAPLLRSWLTAA
jgi:pimeloyl-ACP methyl ester carboxylesterase